MTDSNGRGGGPETTAELLSRVRRGDAAARDRLASRYLPALNRWARGRLPRFARDMWETDDLVQVTILRALDRVKEFEPGKKGSFLAYMRQILKNQIRDRIRAAQRKPESESLNEEMPETRRSPLEEAIGHERLDSYERALGTLRPAEQEAVIMRLELGFTHREVAEQLGCPSPNAARMMVARALVRLIEVMDER